MEVITVDSKAFKEIIERLETLAEYVNTLKPAEQDDSDKWVDTHEVCLFLRISERTLQRLRSKGKISYTNLGGKYYYQISQIKQLLKERVIKSTDNCLEELVQHHRLYGSAKDTKLK